MTCASVLVVFPLESLASWGPAGSVTHSAPHQVDRFIFLTLHYLGCKRLALDPNIPRGYIDHHRVDPSNSLHVNHEDAGGTTAHLQRTKTQPWTSPCLKGEMYNWTAERKKPGWKLNNNNTQKRAVLKHHDTKSSLRSLSQLLHS